MYITYSQSSILWGKLVLALLFCGTRGTRLFLFKNAEILDLLLFSRQKTYNTNIELEDIPTKSWKLLNLEHSNAKFKVPTQLGQRPLHNHFFVFIIIDFRFYFFSITLILRYLKLQK